MPVEENIGKIVGVAAARERGRVGYDLWPEKDLWCSYEQRVDSRLVNQYVASEIREVEAGVVV